MKFSVIGLTLLVMVGCGHCSPKGSNAFVPKANPSFDSSKPYALPEDYLVLTAAINHFSTLKDAKRLNNRKGVNSIVLLGKTPKGTGMVEVTQMQNDLGSQYKDIQGKLSANLQARNLKSTSLMAMKGRSKRIEVLKSYPSRAKLFPREQPKKVWVESWLPGYSTDGRQAVIRFWFGPSPHGAVGTYLMVKQNQQWKVKWHKLAFYA